MVAPAALLASAEPARADAIEPAGSLGEGLSLATAVTVGDVIYVAGGNTPPGGLSAKILRYDPATGVSTHVASLPSGRTGAAGAFDGTYVYFFGGFANGAPQSEIVRFNPATNVVDSPGFVMPGGRYLSSAIWDGTHAYVFGGQTSDYISDVLRCDMSSGCTAAPPLPETNGYAAAVWAGHAAFIVGGWGNQGGGNAANDDIIIYYTNNGTSFRTGAKLGEARYALAAALDRGTIFVFGGYRPGDTTRIDAYSIADNVVTQAPLSLPQPRSFVAAAFQGGSSYVFGGQTGGVIRSDVLRYTTIVPPGAPAASAAAGPGAGEITISWTPPSADGGSAITAYRIHAGPAGGESEIATVDGAARSFVHAGLPDGAIRSYRVAASNLAGDGTLSAAVSARTFERPSAPGDLSARPGDRARDLVIEWEAPSYDGGSPVTGYRIYRGPVDEPNVLLAEVGDVRSYVDSTCGDTGTICYYNVTATNVVGEGESSGYASSMIGLNGPANRVPPRELPLAVPALSSPSVGSQEVVTPGVSTPATCELEPCHEATTVEGQDASTPAVPAVGATTPPVVLPRTCDPTNVVICIGPFTIPGQPVGPTPPVPSQTVTTPGGSAPALCAAAPPACLAPTELLASRTISTPPLGAIPLTPAAAMTVSIAGFEVLAEPRIGQTTTVPATTLNITTPYGDLPVDLCPNTCPAPLAPNALLAGEVTVTVVVGGRTESFSFPASVQTE